MTERLLARFMEWRAGRCGWRFDHGLVASLGQPPVEEVRWNASWVGARNSMLITCTSRVAVAACAYGAGRPYRIEEPAEVRVRQ